MSNTKDAMNEQLGAGKDFAAFSPAGNSGNGGTAGECALQHCGPYVHWPYAGRWYACAERDRPDISDYDADRSLQLSAGMGGAPLASIALGRAIRKRHRNIFAMRSRCCLLSRLS